MKVFRLSFIAFICVAGCSRGPAALHPPSVSSATAARAAIEKYDRNGDGKLSNDELAAAPELLVIADQCDANNDRALDADEIQAGIEKWKDSAVGPRQVPFTITLDSRPLAGAMVNLVPASFFGSELKGATGKSGPTGGGQLAMSPEDMPKAAPKLALVQAGLYRVEITHPSVKIPAKYNAESTLGIEVSSSNPGPQGVHWSLSTH
jgi:hypothetical protein